MKWILTDDQLVDMEKEKEQQRAGRPVLSRLHDPSTGPPREYEVHLLNMKFMKYEVQLLNMKFMKY